MSDVETHLRRVPLFRGMTDTAIEAVAGLAVESAFDADAPLTVEGEPGDAFFVIVEGVARVTRGGRDVRALGPGDFVGEISLIDGRPRTATVTATEPLQALVIRRADFLALMDRFPSVRLGVLMAMTERVRANQRQDLD